MKQNSRHFTINSSSETIDASIALKPGQQLDKIRLMPCGSSNPWRFLSDASAIQLVAVCDSEALPAAKEPPICDRLEVWPVQWGYPDSLVTDHPDMVEQLRQEHIAGKHDLIDGNYTWKHWLQHYGKAELWHQFRTPEMERIWFNWQTGPGSILSTYAGLADRVRREQCKLIRFQADFYCGDRLTTIFLSQCHDVPLTVEERNNLPAHIQRQERFLANKIKLEQLTAKHHRKEAQARREWSRQSVNRQQVRDAFAPYKIKTDRGISKILARQKFDRWPETQGELDSLMRKYKRSKKSASEAMAKRNKDRARNRRGSDSDKPA